MATSEIKILLAQINPTVGDIKNNTQHIIDIITHHSCHHDLIVFPELVLCGYPPDDLLTFPEFIATMEHHFQKIIQQVQDCKVIMGLVRKVGQRLYNSVALIDQQQVKFYDKKILPDTSVFQESRYFTPGHTPYLSFNIHKHRFGILICEDIWHPNPLQDIIKKKIDSIIILNASPYHIDKFKQRVHILKQHNLPINYIYVNQVGGQDDILFDGQSFILDRHGTLQTCAPAFQEALCSIKFSQHHYSGNNLQPLDLLTEIYLALKYSLQEFLKKNRLSKVVLGLSGGIDSALCLAIAVDALGPENVHAILMPSKYTAKISTDGAIEQANILGVSFDIIPIDPHIQPLQQTFTAQWQQELSSLTQQNLQARIRGLILMSYANQHQAMLLSTSNKSEIAVGYSTLYGDMCGGFAPLKDVYKTQIYALAHYINRHKTIIPHIIIKRPPSAELYFNQTDQDDLPDYALLDSLLMDIIEHHYSEDELHQKYASQWIKPILSKIKNSEFKRFQSPPGPKITELSFGKDWRMPLSHAWKI